MEGAAEEVRPRRLWLRHLAVGALFLSAAFQPALADVPLATSAPSLRGFTGKELLAAMPDGCHCRGRLKMSAKEAACECDFLAWDLGQEMPSLGLDRCAASGICEACSPGEIALGYCLRTQQRQKVFCASCRPGAAVTSHACSASVSPIWVVAPSVAYEAKGTLATKPSARAASINASAPGSDGEYLFYRSCGSPPSAGEEAFEDRQYQGDSDNDSEGHPVPDYLVEGQDDEDNKGREEHADLQDLQDNKGHEDNEEHQDRSDEDGHNDHDGHAALEDQMVPTQDQKPLVVAKPVANKTGSSRALSKMRLLPRDESKELLFFAGANAVVLALALVSLRRQQRKILDATMNRLYDSLEIPTDMTPTPTEQAKTTRDKNRAVSSHSLEEAAGTIGRSFETMATAVARSTGNAIERAVQEATDSFPIVHSVSQKMK